MTSPDFTTRPVWDEFTMDVPAAEAFEMSRERLRSLGYRLVQAVAESEDGSSKVVATLDRSPAARRRRSGKLMLVAAVSLTLVLLVMMARGIGDDRAVVSVPLLAAVLLGGMGMNRLREPLRPEHKVMEITVMPAQEGHCRVLIKGTLVSGPLAVTEEPPSAAQTAASEEGLLEDMRVVQGSRSSTEESS